MSDLAPGHVKCPLCHLEVRVTVDDKVRRHRKNGRRCPNSGVSAAVLIRALRRNKEMTQ